MECSGFYFHIEPKNFFLGARMYVFDPYHLKKFREIVANPEKAKELDRIIKSILRNKGFSIGGKTFKKRLVVTIMIMNILICFFTVAFMRFMKLIH
jgi:hypothetical protein